MESSTVTQEPVCRALDAPTLGEAFHRTVRIHGDRVAVRTVDDAVSLTWSELRARVDALAAGLARLGVGPGGCVALMLANRPEFHIADLAVVTLRATPFSIYQTYTPNQIEFVVADAAARVAIVEQAYLTNVLEARPQLPELEHVIVVDGEVPEGCLALAEVEGSGEADFDPERAIAQATPQDILTVIYTSGTTGPPKGVQLSHRNLLSAMMAIEELVDFPEGSRVISWLPAAHIAERGSHHYIPIMFGFTVTCCSNPREILGYLPQVRPNWFFAVPRIWEKLKSGLEAMIGGQPDEQRRATEQGLQAAIEKVRLEQSQQPVPDELAARVAQADQAIFSGLRTQLGLDQVVAINVGAAPTPPEVLEFFHAIGLELAELWGMSETCGAGTVNPPGRVKIGTVGPAMPGVEIRLEPDGEVQIKSDIVMVGYRNLPDKTAEIFTEDGWLRTGDIGQIDEDGYLTIVDRKKEIIINAAGKNMSPANIESTLKAASPVIGQACAIGDARPYNTALIVLDADFAPMWAAAQGIADNSLESLAADERMRAAVQEGVDQANVSLSRVEQIKKFTLVSGDWLPGGEELTPTMKLRRKPILEKYRSQIEAMYS